MAEYRLSPAAERDLEDIWTYTVEHCGADQADRYTDLPGPNAARQIALG